MNGEIQPNEGFDLREIYIEKTLGEQVNFENSQVGFENQNNNQDMLFEKVAKGVANNEKIMNIGEFNRNAVIFQQETIKDILAIKNNDSKKDLEEAKKYWEKYDKDTMIQAGRMDNCKDKEKVMIEFEHYKIAAQGSLAVIRFFEEKGFKVKFPVVDDDIFKQCDLIFEKDDYNLAIQLKSYKTSAKNSKETEKEGGEIISADYYDLKDKKQQDSFAVLRNYCLNLSKKTRKNYFPLFMKVPISIDAHNPKWKEPTKCPLFNEMGFPMPKVQIKDTMDNLWDGIPSRKGVRSGGIAKLLTSRNKSVL